MPKKYDILYMDPPWQFNKRSNTNTKFGGGAMAHYPTMTMKEIKALDYSKCLNDNALVYCWVTLAKLAECIDAITRDDIKLVATGFVWVKTNKLNDTPVKDKHLQITIDGKYTTPFYGVGNYTASNAEICLILRKGKMVKYDKKVSQIIISPREQHSRKPTEAYERLTTMYPTQNKLELFARTSYPGFDVVGNQLNASTVEEFLENY